MGGKYGTCTNIFRVLFIIMNVVFVVLGSALIGFGSYLIYLGEEHSYDEITGSEFVSAAAILVTAGVITFAVSVVGILGALLMLRPFLFIYILVIVVIILLEIAGGIVAFVHRDELLDEVDQRMTDAFLDYTIGPDDPNYMEDVNDVVAYVQETFRCCGVNGSEDWFIHHIEIVVANGFVPPRECLCDEDESNCESFNFTVTADEVDGLEVDQPVMYSAWDRGCIDVVEDNLDTLAIAVGVLGVAFGVIEIFGILVAIGLCVSIFKRNNDTFV